MDDLLDLDWDKKPAAPPLRQQGAAAPAYRAPGQSSTYSFDALTRSMPSTAAQTQKKPSPSPSPTPPMGYSLSSQSQAPKAQAQAQASAAKTGDAFSSLFAGAAGGGGGQATSGAGASSSSAPKANSNLSMAQRLQGNSSNNHSLLNPTRANQSQKANGDAWSGLESLGFSQPASKGPSPSVSQNQSNDDFFNFDDFTSQKATPRAPTAAAARSKASPAAPPAAAPQPKSKDPFDFSDFEDPGDSQSSALGGGGGGGGEGGRRKEPERPSEGPMKTAQTGLSRGPGLLGDDDYDDGIDDGILGALGGPPGRAKPAAMATAMATGASQPRPASPPPHIIGQVVEMGFSPFEAREALARTGNDESAALEQLLASSSSSKATERPSHSSQEQEDRRYAERLQRREQAAQRPPASSNGRNGPERKRREDERDAAEDGQVDWQKQADQIYAQASELGASVFSKANAFWTTAKAQAQRALEERNNNNLDGQGSSAASSGRNSPASGSERAKSRRWAVPSRDGRSTPRKEWEGKPRWMVEAEAAAAAEEEEEEQSRPKKQPSGETAPTSSFRDDDDGDEVAPAPPFLPARPEGSRPREDAPRNLWDMDPQAPPPSSSAPARPQASKPRPGAAAAAAPASGARRTPAAKAAAAAAAARTARPIEEDGAAAVESSKRHKARGNEHFKKGAYGEAETAYSAGLDALDAHPKSLRRVPLLNNRANARLKNGDARAVLADTKDVLVLIVAGGKSPFTLYRPSGEAPLPGALAQEVNLRDGYAKALLRRAQAEEMLEQWDTARSVWTLLERYEKEEGSSGTTGVTNLRAAQEGAKRCQKMLQPAAASEGGAQAAGVQHKDVVRQKVDRATARAVAKAEESARARIRAENAATAAEEAAKHALRDGVDARILAWKGGKEANVRALLASLQDVVWDGLGWKKVGMHELVTDAQVKRNYMKAIGKLHPDKLTPRNNSLEERLLGGAVFSVLNDAWSAQP
ncbi:hypothetical protein FA10DRAFT_264667 [Acaromyces ingoldii]|uniref:UBA domain-containing protein n=1 Tax=Acaromyces ingoldii TaxID=215250 RepID=A0A316YYD6_9BASI|nr:hypothetical protein FA10DRAFT_264667 [Acaromyces ingoldii]PWN94076.1 hypothetical protein FA10DRAFT_264667 [Acaromyces ingoldii]